MRIYRKEQRFISIVTVYASSAESLIDMMRYDSCYPSTEEDAYKIGRLMTRDGSADDHIVTLIRCARNDLPATKGRWKSFNCIVLDERHPETSPMPIDKLRAIAVERSGAKKP